MPPTRQDRVPERTDGITVELTEFGLWIEVHDQPGGWQGVFLSARRCGTWSSCRPRHGWRPWPPSTRPPTDTGGIVRFHPRTATANPAPPNEQREGPGVGRPTIGTGRRPLPPPPQGVIASWLSQLYRLTAVIA
jgi:hypothetical protein